MDTPKLLIGATSCVFVRKQAIRPAIENTVAYQNVLYACMNQLADNVRKKADEATMFLYERILPYLQSQKRLLQAEKA